MMQNVLFVSQRIPYPPTKGDKIRSYNFLRHLSERYEVYLGCFVDDPEDWRYVPELRQMVAHVFALPLVRSWAYLRSLSGIATGEALSVPYFADRRMKRWVRQVMGEIRPSTAFIFSSPMAQYLMGEERPPRLLMDFVDVDSDKWRQYADRQSGPMAWVYRREAERLLAFERKVASRADLSLFVSPAEQALFCSMAPESAARTRALPNGVDADFFSPDHGFAAPFKEAGPAVVFTGAMDYWPNIEAVRWFSTEVLPILRCAAPDLQFIIVGANPTPEVAALGSLPGVVVVGRVPDTRPYLAHAAVVVAPLLTARGIQNKVLEGMAMGRPVVATTQAHEGIDAVDGVHLMVADGADGFAVAVLRLLDSGAADAVGRAARQRILELYDWRSRFVQLDGMLSVEGMVEV